MPIDAQIRHVIRKNGHIPIDDMMREVLSINKSSYYKSTKNIGVAGDFITSPEISQLFGEMIALWAIEQWEKLGKPKQFILFELGPGQGILMKDLLRVAKLVPEFLDSMSIHLLEINPYFIEKQKKSLSLYGKKIIWHKEINTVPKLPMIMIANEFFDALPIKQYTKSKKNWKEIVLTADRNTQHLKFHYVSLQERLEKQLLLDHKSASDGSVIEESVKSMDIMRFIGERLTKYYGSAIIIDYGYEIYPRMRKKYQYNSTLQAVKDHEYQSIISSLGEADLSAHVDFYALKMAAHEQGIKLENMITCSQRAFLLQYGILERLKSLHKQINSADIKKTLDAQVNRLIAKDQMGELFKVMQVWAI